MQEPVLTQRRLSEIVSRFSGLRVGVIGDYFLDMYLDTDPALAEPSRETGLTAHQVIAVHTSPGAAGNVAVNMASLSAGTVEAIGFTGDDPNGHELRKRLTANGISTSHLLCLPSRVTPTYMKPRDCTKPGLAGELDRLDIQNRTVTPLDGAASIRKTLMKSIQDLDALAVIDQVERNNCGTITASVADSLNRIAWGKKYLTVTADSRRDITRFRNIALIPNQHELMGNDNPGHTNAVSVDDLIEKGTAIREAARAPIFTTLAERGMILFHEGHHRIPTVRHENPIDPTGAGDTVTAAVTLALAAGSTPTEAGIIGMLAASVTVDQLGECGTCSSYELSERLERWTAEAGA